MSVPDSGWTQSNGMFTASVLGSPGTRHGGRAEGDTHDAGRCRP